MNGNEPLVVAVQEIQAVTAELREVKKRADQYGQTSARLQEVSQALVQLANAVSSMQAAFDGLLSRASSVIGRFDETRLVAEATAKSIPDIVARIEATDVSSHVGAVSQSLEAVNARIATQVSLIEQMQALQTKERDEQRKTLESIAARSERMESDIAFLRAAAERHARYTEPLAGQLEQLHALLTGLTEPVAATRAASDKAANASAVYGHKGFQAITELAKKADGIQSTLETQNKLLTAINDKKGFVF
ncbi:MAG: hypothetical protein U1F48_00240 [Burkholderiales bacterium]